MLKIEPAVERLIEKSALDTPVAFTNLESSRLRQVITTRVNNFFPSGEADSDRYAR